MTVPLLLGQSLLKMSLATEAALCRKYDTAEIRFYEDKFVRLTDTELEIKNYYGCCFGQSKVRLLKRTVDVRSIRGVYFAAQEVSCFTSWGLSPSTSTWFAFQGGRACSSSDDIHNVIIEIGEDSTKGFSCSDIYEFIKVLRPLVSEDTIFADEIK